MKTIIYLTTILLIYISSPNGFSQQAVSESIFYSVSSATPNVLYQNDPISNTWAAVGETGTNHLKALAYNNIDKVLYGIDGGVLGTIDIQTGQFSAINTANLGTGFYGEVDLNQVEALTYDPFSKLLFATHNIPGVGKMTNDLFFKINPATGLIVKDATFDFKKRRFDYVPIAEILREAVSVKDILGLAINPINYDLVALHRQNGFNSITKLNKKTGAIEEVLYNSYSSFSDIAYDQLGNLYATIGEGNHTQTNTFVQIDVDGNSETVVNKIGSASNPNLNFESLTSTAVTMQVLKNDLALRMRLSAGQNNPLKQGSVVSFDITVFNQGALTINEVRLSATFNQLNVKVLNLGIDKSKWIRFGNRIYGSFKNTIEPGEHFTAIVEVELKDDFTGMMTLVSEIYHAYNYNMTTESGNFLAIKKDVDSNYDDLENETNIVNNNINGNGINEDEDDHDIVMIEVERANNLILSPCYTVSSQENAPNVLFEFNPETEKWTEVGVTGGTSIEAIATDPVNNLIYAVDGGTFGIINTNTGRFTPYGAVGMGDGAFGTIALDNIKGLTYDPINQVMYAIHRIGGDGPGTNDLFFQIDVSTGGLIPVAMQDPDTGSPIDYVTIMQVFGCTFQKTGNCEYYDVDDIAYNPYTGQLFAIQNGLGLNEAVITELNTVTGTLESVIFDTNDQSDLEGLGFTSLGELYATQGDMGTTEEEKNNLIKIDLGETRITSLGKIDPDDGIPPAEQVDFEALDCFTAYNDLALKMELDPSVAQPVSLGSKVTFNITIYNQGKFTNTDVQIVNYIPTGFILTDYNWSDLGAGIATYTKSNLIEPGASLLLSISFLIDENFEGYSAINTAEIFASFNPQVVDRGGNALQLPDWDSFPDNINDELEVADNELNGGGPNAGEDEDDHDIALVEIEEPVITPPNNSATYFPCYTVSEDNLPPNVLFEFNPLTGNWTQVSTTGGTSIEAIATDPINDIIYATDAGIFGIINSTTASFTPIGEVGTGNGDAGLIDLDDVDGLTFDPVNQIMYGVHRVSGQGPGTNDVLFQIDVLIGQVIFGAMVGANGNPTDYAIIQEVFDSTFYDDVYDVDDIAYNPYKGKLYATQNQDGPGAITELNPLTGEIIEVVFDISEDDVEGLGVSYLGELYATTGDSGNLCASCGHNLFFYIDIGKNITTELDIIDPTGIEVDFEAFDCFTAYNDLALKVAVDPNNQQPIYTGQTVSFLMTIYNQGDFRNTNIELTNYIPNGLSLSDTKWTITGDNKATLIVPAVLEAGATKTVSITFKVEPGFDGQTITNTAEISASYSPDIIGVQGNYYADALPDLDSQPDNENNETNVTDNDLNGGGENSISNKDEDDHDIAVIEIQPVRLIINPEFCNKMGSVEVEIMFSEGDRFDNEWLDAEGYIIQTFTTTNKAYTVPDLASGWYTVAITDNLGQTRTIKILVPFTAALNGNTNCDNTCPNYLIVPEGAIQGDFKAQQTIEIKGFVKKSQTAVFDICK